jgi:hypothetical protein
MAGATVLRIDPATSFVRLDTNMIVCDVFYSNCTPAPTFDFSISGTFAIDVRHLDGLYGPPRDEFKFTDIHVRSGALARGFFFPDYRGLLTESGELFANSNDCWLFLMDWPGSSCFYQGISAGFSGTWDGETLLIDGVHDEVMRNFQFSIRASALPEPSAVPEPSTALALVLGVLMIRSHARNKDHEKRDQAG